MARTFDVVVIGAGVVGASIAFHLARAGAGRVGVLERDHVCAGNTRKSGALIRMHYTNRPEAALALASLRYFRHWADLVGGDCGFRQTGFALLVDPTNLERLRRNVGRLAEMGVNTRVVSPEELRDLQPGLGLDGIGAAAYEPESGYADPVATTESLIRRARDHGAEVLEGTAVREIRVAGGRVVGVTTDTASIDAAAVVCAANTWSPPLLRTAGVQVDLWCRRGQMAFFRQPRPEDRPRMVLIDTTLGTYARPDGEDGFGGGMTALTGTNPDDPDRYDEQVDPEFPAEARRQLARRMPRLAAATYARGQAGLYDMSPDTRAILDRAPGVEGLFLAVGFSGTGFKKAPAVGACMAELVLEGRASTVDLAPFRFGRFAAGSPLRGEDEYELPTDWGHSF